MDVILKIGRHSRRGIPIMLKSFGRDNLSRPKDAYLIKKKQLPSSRYFLTIRSGTGPTRYSWDVSELL